MVCGSCLSGEAARSAGAPRSPAPNKCSNNVKSGCPIKDVTAIWVLRDYLARTVNPSAETSAIVLGARPQIFQATNPEWDSPTKPSP